MNIVSIRLMSFMIVTAKRTKHYGFMTHIKDVVLPLDPMHIRGLEQHVDSGK